MGAMSGAYCVTTQVGHRYLWDTPEGRAQMWREARAAAEEAVRQEQVRAAAEAAERWRRVMRKIVAVGLVVAVAVVAALLALGVAQAASPNSKGKIAAPEQPKYEPPRYTAPAEELPAYNVHNWYAGLAGGYAWTPEHFEDTWTGGVFAGYLWRPKELGGLWGVGVEVDYMLRDLGSFQLDDGVTSLRGRLGLFVTPRTFVYGTAGTAVATPAFVPQGYRKGAVVGAGVEQDLGGKAFARLEGLVYNHTDEHFGWADSDDERSAVVKFALGLKF